jgi:hypothetical protein
MKSCFKLKGLEAESHWLEEVIGGEVAVEGESHVKTEQTTI